jgi:hypothetical protein
MTRLTRLLAAAAVAVGSLAACGTLAPGADGAPDRSDEAGAGDGSAPEADGAAPDARPPQNDDAAAPDGDAPEPGCPTTSLFCLDFDAVDENGEKTLAGPGMVTLDDPFDVVSPPYALLATVTQPPQQAYFTWVLPDLSSAAFTFRMRVKVAASAGVVEVGRIAGGAADALAFVADADSNELRLERVPASDGPVESIKVGALSKDAFDLFTFRRDASGLHATLTSQNLAAVSLAASSLKLSLGIRSSDSADGAVVRIDDVVVLP